MFSNNTTTLVAAVNITDNSGDTNLSIPAGTQMEILSIESDDCAIVTANGFVFIVSPDECE